MNEHLVLHKYVRTCIMYSTMYSTWICRYMFNWSCVHEKHEHCKSTWKYSWLACKWTCTVHCTIYKIMSKNKWPRQNHVMLVFLPNNFAHIYWKFAEHFHCIISYRVNILEFPIPPHCVFWLLPKWHNHVFIFLFF